MKWRTPKAGDARDRIRFALLPIALTSGETVWFERYCVREELQRWPGDIGLRWVVVWRGLTPQAKEGT